jgi:uncharacterized protein (DUF58 family)
MPASRDFATRAKPGLVILISDLLGAGHAQDIRHCVTGSRRGGHSALAESEIDPPLDGALRMVDAETGDELEVTVDRELRRLYQQRLERQLQEVEEFCRRRGVEYLRASTAVSFEDVVLKYLRQGAHLR